MSHIRPEDRSIKHSRSECRKGRHNHGEAQNIGAGILRRVCGTCGEVSIDLTATDELRAPVIRTSGKIGSFISGNSLREGHRR